ncbi:MAG: hypothetical protein U9P00_10650 [Pseudomonadota bacterium]|nr:hypothetical protein [Pseudomonadota bacterium]
MPPLPRQLDRTAKQSKPPTDLKWVLAAVSVVLTTTLVVMLNDHL